MGDIKEVGVEASVVSVGEGGGKDPGLLDAGNLGCETRAVSIADESLSFSFPSLILD